LTRPRARLGRGDEAARQQHLHRLLGLHVAHQGHAGGAAEQAHVDAVDAEAHALGGHRQVALRHQLAACGGAMPCTRAITGTGSFSSDTIILLHWPNSW
jgi:hypothetical protein